MSGMEWAALGFAGGWLSCSVFVGILIRSWRAEDGPAGMGWKDHGE